MRVRVYCFLPNIKFDPVPKPFKVKDGEAWIENDSNGCSLTYETAANLDDFLHGPEDPNDHDHKIYFKKIGELLDKYRGDLNEIATVIEGLVSIMTIKPFPAFLLQHVNVRLHPESKEDQKLIKEEKVHHTFGDIGRSRGINLDTVGSADEILKYSVKAGDRLSALSIYTLAARAEDRFELEIAYSNYFRIIEGYFGDGTQYIERSLKLKATEIIKLIQPTEEFLAGLKSILSSLTLKSVTNDINDVEGIVHDLVVLRHKLMHYNLANQDTHFYSSMRVDLKVILPNIHRAALMLIRNDIENSH